MLWKLRQRQLQWLAGEKGTILKDWGGKISVALVFPNLYSVGMSNLGFQAVYGLLNEAEGVVCERVFYPEPEDLPAIRGNTGKLLSVESQRPIRDFEFLFFSIPFENDYTNALEILQLGGVPARAEHRDRRCPFVAAGGVAVFLNPEPLAPFMDFMFIGESEALLPDFWSWWKDLKHDESISRQDLLFSLGREVGGVYVPLFYRPAYQEGGAIYSVKPEHADLPEKVIYRRADLSSSKPCQTVITTSATEFSSIKLLEIGRGCGRGCRFCAAGFVYRPLRYHSADKLIDAVGTDSQGGSRVGLISAAVSDHPEISYICRSLLDKGASLSFSSLRADGITADMVSALKLSGHQAVAIAPEAGSERLRHVINKKIKEEEVLNAAEMLVEGGILHLKLYFMIGLPTETLEDLEAIVEMTKKIKHHVLKKSRGQKRLGAITLSIHSFVPKPFTPFQWLPFAGVKELKERSRWIQKALKKVPNIRVHFDLPKWAYVQALLARGDRRVGLFLEKVALEGCTWSQAMRSVPINPDFWVMRQRDQHEVFPWEIIDLGVKRAYLWDEYQKALQGQQSPVCRVDENCCRCGVCAP